MKQDAGEKDEDHYPSCFTNEAQRQLPALNLSEQHRGRKVGQVHQRRQADERPPGLRKHVERKHVPAEEEAEEHVDEEQRADLQPPKSHEAHTSLQKEAQQKAEHQRECPCDKRRKARPAGKETSAEPEHEGEGQDRHDVVCQLMRHAAEEEEAEKIDGLNEELFYFAVANLGSDA